jgi:hypothetical protein
MELKLDVELPQDWNGRSRKHQSVLTNALGKTTQIHEQGEGKAELVIMGIEELTDDTRQKIAAAGFRLLAV